MARVVFDRMDKGRNDRKSLKEIISLLPLKSNVSLFKDCS